MVDGLDIQSVNQARHGQWGLLCEIFVEVSSTIISFPFASRPWYVYILVDIVITVARNPHDPSSISQSPFSTTSHSGTLSSLVNFFFSLSANLIGAGNLKERTNSVPAALPRKV